MRRAYKNIFYREENEKKKKKKIVPNGFEPLSPAPKAGMIDHYTTGLR